MPVIGTRYPSTAPLPDIEFEAAIGPEGAKGDIGPRGLQGTSGTPGNPGPTGPIPAHQWIGTAVRFQNPDGSWGALVDLGGVPTIPGGGSDPDGVADFGNDQGELLEILFPF